MSRIDRIAGWRHPIVFVVGRDPRDELARIGIARRDCFECVFAGIEPQIAFVFFAMTAEAVFAEDRQHLFVEFRGLNCVGAGTPGERAIGSGLEERIDRMFGGIRNFVRWIRLNPSFCDFMPRFPECILCRRGSPALAIPTGFAQSGLPLSMQIIGKPFEEALIYQVAHAFEQASDWTNRRPPLPDA